MTLSIENHVKETQQDIVDKFIDLGYNDNIISDGINNFNERVSWNLYSECLIYSRSKQKWFPGKIIKIFTDVFNEEWLIIRYNKTQKKDIQRFSADIKPIHNYDNKFKVNQIVNYGKMINKCNHKETMTHLYVYGFTRIYCTSFFIPIDIQEICLFMYTKLYVVNIHEKLQNSQVTITFDAKPLGLTLYRGENEINAWIADMIDGHIHIKNGLKIGLYVHTINNKIFDNENYYHILETVRGTPAPITVGFNIYPPLNEPNIHIQTLMRLGYTFNELQYGWQQLNKIFDTMTTENPNFEFE
eukprot:554737_1